MRKIYLFLTISIILLFPSKLLAYTDETKSLTSYSPFDTVQLNSQKITSSITLSNPITIKGGIFETSNEEPVITINSNDVTLDGLTIIDHSSEGIASINVTGENVTIKNTKIITNRSAVWGENLENIHIINNSIDGTTSKKGIQLYNSNEGIIEGNKIINIEDGIYFEHNTNFSIKNNEVNNGRYGLHIMFGEEISISSNTVTKNIIGMMVMATKKIILTNNIITNQLDDVNASGLTIFDVNDCEIINNVIEKNRYGIIFQESQSNLLKSNLLNQNIIALQFLKSEKNRLINNTFLGNVTSGETWESKDNMVSKNFWDNAITIDWDNDGLSNSPYYFQSFYMRLNRLNEGYSLLYGQPGLTVLETLIPPTSEGTLVDQNPTISTTSLQEARKSATSPIHLVFIVVLSYLWYIGRKLS